MTNKDFHIESRSSVDVFLACGTDVPRWDAADLSLRRLLPYYEVYSGKKITANLVCKYTEGSVSCGTITGVLVKER